MNAKIAHIMALTKNGNVASIPGHSTLSIHPLSFFKGHETISTKVYITFEIRKHGAVIVTVDTERLQFILENMGWLDNLHTHKPLARGAFACHTLSRG